MNISDMIKQAREDLGLTQEDLAEKLEVSRQAVSKWELGASTPSPENLELLEEVLGVKFPPPEEEPIPQSVPQPEPAGKPSFWNWKRVVLLILAVLMILGIISAIIFDLLIRESHRAGPTPIYPDISEPCITGVYFFDENAVPLRPDLGDGWNSFTAGERVLVLVEFEDSPDNSVNAVSLFLTPTGTETLDQREQIAIQAAGEGRKFALFAWDIPGDLMGHLEVVLECGGGLQVTETLNVTAPESPEEPETLTIPIGATLFMDEPHLLLLRATGAPEEEIVWTSSNPAVVEVTGIGALFPVSPGSAVVTASWKDQTAECQVEVFTETVPTDVPGVSKAVR